MKIVCTKKNLNEGLNTCSRIINSGNALPVLNNILLKTDNGRIKVSSTNLEMAINKWVGGKIEEEGDITVPARLINDYISNLTEDKITISSQDQTLFLEAEQSKSHIKGLSSDEFPLIPKISEQVFTRVSGQELAQKLSEVVFAASYSETQPEISGVLFNFNREELLLAATDRYRLAETKLGFLEKPEQERMIIIPARAASELIKSLNQKEGVEIYLSEGQAMFRSDDIEIITRLIEGQYPDYQQIIPKNFTTEVEIHRADLAQALRAVSLFSSESNNIEVELVPQSKKLVVRSESAQTGDSEVQLEAAGRGEKTTVVFNHRYLLDCLNSLAEETVNLKVIDSSSPAAVVPKGREDYLYIVMPIKT